MLEKLKVAVFSGGRGTASLTKALIDHSEIDLTIIVNAYDDGLSTGELRRFIPGMLGPSDVRKNLARLVKDDSDNGQALTKVLEYRFPLGLSEDQGLKLLNRLKNDHCTNELIDLDDDYAQLNIFVHLKRFHI